MSDIYNTNSVPHGGKTLTMYSSAGADLGDYKFENINISRPVTKIERKDTDGSAKDWVAVPGCPTLTATIQLPATASDWPLAGNYIVQTFDANKEEKFVFVEPSPGIVMGDYTKINVIAHGDLGFALVGNWALTSAATDSSGNGLTLTLAGGAAVSGGSLVLDGDGDYATRADNVLLDASNGEFTACCYLKSGEAIVGSDHYIFSKYTGGIGWYIKLQQTSGQAMAGVANGATTVGLGGLDALVDDVWHHVALVRLGKILKLYVDGVLNDSSSSVPATLDLSNSAPLRIGADDSGANAFNGRIKAVRFYRTALSVEEIAAIKLADA